MAFDALEMLTGSAGHPEHVVTDDENTAGIYVGRNTVAEVQLRIPGEPAGTLDVRLQDSADGVTYADMGVSFDQVSAAQAEDDPILRRTISTKDRPYVRAVLNVSGSDDVPAPGLSLVVVPVPGAVLQQTWA